MFWPFFRSWYEIIMQNSNEFQKTFNEFNPVTTKLYFNFPKQEHKRLKHRWNTWMGHSNTKKLAMYSPYWPLFSKLNSIVSHSKFNILAATFWENISTLQTSQKLAFYRKTEKIRRTLVSCTCHAPTVSRRTCI